MNALRGRVLQLGPVSPQSQPQEILCAGPWVFAGQEALFPHWEKRFSFAPEPFATEDQLVRAGQRAMLLTGEYLPRLAKTLSTKASDLPDSYWETLLIPWVGLVAEQIVERWLRIKVLLRDFGHEPLQIPLLADDLDFDFIDENDVSLRGALGLTFNHWLFSWLLRRSPLPETWQITKIEAKAYKKPEQKPQSIKQRLREATAKALLRLPFPHLKGVSLWQSLRFSIALAHPSAGPDRSHSLTELLATFTERNDDFCTDLLPIFLKAMPRSLKKLRHPRALPKAAQSRVFVASIRAYEDSQYRQHLACLRARGHRLMFIQHGGNYGQIKNPCRTRMFEFQQHAFGTWGWAKYEGVDGHFLPFPYPQLQRIADQHKKKNEELIFVGTEMPLLAYRLDCRPSPMATVDYRKAKETFFSTLEPKLIAHTCYRPYFDLPASLADADWLLPRFPKLRRLTGPLWPALRDCRLLVLDHHGTTLLEAMAANIPLLVTFSPAHWPLTQDSRAMFQTLAKAGIFFADASLCALQANRIWQDVSGWWSSQSVQEARRAFCHAFALTIQGDETPYLIEQLKIL